MDQSIHKENKTKAKLRHMAILTDTTSVKTGNKALLERHWIDQVQSSVLDLAKFGTLTQVDIKFL